MFESKELQVKPVRRYRAPRYPSHADPDPTLHPTPVPYPASSKLLAAVAVMGVAASTSCSEQAATEVAPAGGNVEVVDAPQPPAEPPAKNPFPLSSLALPFRPSSFGTGQPTYIDTRAAIKAIDEIFQQSGYQLAPRVPYHRGDVALVTDGYDAQKKVGFVVGSAGNVEDDAFMGAAQTGLSLEAAAMTVFGRASRTRGMEDVVKEFQAARDLPDPARREAAYRALLTQAGQDRISLYEIQLLENPRANHQDFVAFISIGDPRWHLTWDHNSAQAEIVKLGVSPTDEQLSAVYDSFLAQGERKALDRLQQAVREYIAWARSQGAQ